MISVIVPYCHACYTACQAPAILRSFVHLACRHQPASPTTWDVYAQPEEK